MNTKAQARDWLGLAREVLNVEIEGLDAVRDSLSDGFLEALDCMASCGGRLVITGIGKSGLVGRKIAATLSSTGTPSFFLHPVEGAHGDMGMIRKRDVVLAISNSGETDELNAILPVIRTLGASIVALTSNTGSSMSRLSDFTIQVKVPREACPMGLAPTASTTAALAVGDAIAVCLMKIKGFEANDFQRFHPGGTLGQQLSQFIDTLMHSENLPVVQDDESLSKALEVLNEGGFGLVALVDEDGILSGVLTDGDVRRMVCGLEFDVSEPVSQVMTLSPRRAVLGEKAAMVLDVMETHQITVLPVVREDGKLEGLVHLHDLLGKGRLKFSG